MRNGQDVLLTPPNTIQEKMAESAAALFEKDERLNIRLPESSESVALPRKREQSQEWQRVIYYLLGGLVSLGILLLLAEQMNPPDSALRGQSIAKSLGAWDGLWTGEMTRLTINGDPLETFQVRREHFSSGTNVQSVNIVRELPDGTTQSRFWVFNVQNDGALTARLSETPEKDKLFRGRINGAQIFLSYQGEDHMAILRSRLHENVVFIEEEYLPNDSPGEGWILSGQLTRETRPLL